MTLEGSDERALWKETVTSALRGVLHHATSSTSAEDARQMTNLAIAMADHAALAYRQRDTSRPK